jgi:type I restriction enzyme S subunit
VFYIVGAAVIHEWCGGDNIRSLNTPISPLAEQHRIVAKVDALLALFDQLETQLTTTQTDNRRLLEAVF